MRAWFRTMKKNKRFRYSYSVVNLFVIPLGIVCRIMNEDNASDDW